MRNLRGQFNKREERREAIVNGLTKKFAETAVETGLNAIAFKLNNTETTLTMEEVKSLYSNNEGKVDLDAIENQLRFNAVIAYVCGSEVGANTNGIELGKTITCADDLLKIFKPCSKKNNGSGVRYVTEDGQSPIFQEGVNIFHATTAMGATNTLYKVSYHEQKRFIDVLSQLDLTALTAEDIAMIIRDLDVIGRAMQEIAIDSAKDKTKAAGWTKISELINMSVKMLTKAGVSHNFEAIKAQFRKAKLDGVGEIEDYAMEFDAILPKDAYTKEEFEALSLEEQAQAEASSIVCGLLGHARLAILKGSNAEINELVKAYRNTNSDNYGNYAQYGLNNGQLTTFMKNVYDVVSHSYVLDRKISDEAIEQVRCGIYNEMASNPVLQNKYGAGSIIKYAIAAGMLKLKEQKDGSFEESYEKESFRFGIVSRIFKNEFICEYNNEAGVIKTDNFMRVLLNVTKGSSVELIEGAAYKMVAGVATMFSTGQAPAPVEGVLETREAFTGLAICQNGKLYANYNVNKVEDKTVGVATVKDWFDLKTGKELDATKLYDERALEEHIHLLLNADKVHVTGKDNNLVGAELNGKFYPICRLHYTPGLVEFPADKTTVKSKLISVKDVFGYISPADEDNKYSVAKISGMFTYIAK